jgi:hypothetical protein
MKGKKKDGTLRTALLEERKEAVSLTQSQGVGCLRITPKLHPTNTTCVWFAG